MRHTFYGIFACCASLAAISLFGCGSSSKSIAPVASKAAARNYVGTQAPGDVWTWNLTSTTFSAVNTTRGTSYSGSSTLLDSGYYKLAVTASSDPAAPVGSAAYAFDVPGVAIIVQPAGTITNPVVGAAVGTNPTGSTNYNWISIPSSSWESGHNEAYGTAVIAMTSATSGSILITQNSITGAVLGTHNQPVDWTSGEFTTSGSTGVVTPAGMIMVDNGPGEGGVFGVKAAAANVDLADLASQEYRGMLFKGGGAGASGGTELLKITTNGTGGLDGVAYVNVETGELDPPGNHVTLTFGAQASPGLVNGVLHLHSEDQNIVLAINKIGGKYMIYGFAASSDGVPDNFLLIQK